MVKCEKPEITIDKRAALQLRIFINKLLGNKDSYNTQLAESICEYSHGSRVKRSSLFTDVMPSRFMCVTEVYSPFWCRVVAMPSRIAYHGYGDPRYGKIYYEPNWSNISPSFRKRIFDPYGRPHIKERALRYYLIK